MYTDLKSYQNALIIHDFTVEFVKHYIPVASRTRDQMEQAARSGKQNIAEASTASKQKPKGEIFLLSVANASLKELLEDFQDYLRQHGLTQWEKDDLRALRVRQLVYTTHKSDRTDKSDKSDKSYKTYTSYESYLSDPEQACNAMLCLINQTTYLLDQQIKGVEKQMQEKGITLESHAQNVRRIIAQEREREHAVDAIVAEILKKEKPEIYKL